MERIEIWVRPVIWNSGTKWELAETIPIEADREYEVKYFDGDPAEYGPDRSWRL